MANLEFKDIPTPTYIVAAQILVKARESLPADTTVDVKRMTTWKQMWKAFDGKVVDILEPAFAGAIKAIPQGELAKISKGYCDNKARLQMEDRAKNDKRMLDAMINSPKLTETLLDQILGESVEKGMFDEAYVESEKKRIINLYQQITGQTFPTLPK